MPLLAMVTRGPSTALDIDVNIMEDEHVPIEEMLKVRVGDGADSPLRALVLDRVSLDVFERWGMFSMLFSIHPLLRSVDIEKLLTRRFPLK